MAERPLACFVTDLLAMTPARTPLSTATGLALILLPLIAVGLKCLSFGWMMVMVMFGPIFVLAIGYALQLVIASQAFLSRRAALQSAATRKRATVAAWLTSVGVVVFGVFMPDGGDSGYGSTFQVWLGAYSSPDAEAMHAATDALNQVIAWIAAVVWIGAFLWLVVEWVIGLVQRRRARRAAAAADPQLAAPLA